MTKSSELVPKERQAKWPPANTTELMAYFLEMEREDPATDGISDRAIRLIQALSQLGNVDKATVVETGNKTFPLAHSPEGTVGISHEGLALTYAAYAITGAEMTDSHELPTHNRQHAVYEGSIEVTKSGARHKIPLAFKEVYTTNNDGGIVSMDWSVRTNFPQKEHYESKSLAADPEAVKWDDEERYIYLGAAVEALVTRQGETSEPYYRYPEAA